MSKSGVGCVIQMHTCVHLIVHGYQSSLGDLIALTVFLVLTTRKIFSLPLHRQHAHWADAIISTHVRRSLATCAPVTHIILFHTFALADSIECTSYLFIFLYFWSCHAYPIFRSTETQYNISQPHPRILKYPPLTPPHPSPSSSTSLFDPPPPPHPTPFAFPIPSHRF